MIDPSAALEVLTRAGVDFFTGVPDSLLKEFNSCVVDELSPDSHVVAPNEGSAVAMAAGHFIATGRPAVVYMQNSGLGNSVNPLASLTSGGVYAIPAVLMIGWRGRPGHPDEPQHGHQGRITEDLLGLLDIPVFRLEPDLEKWEATIGAAVEATLRNSGPTALLVSAGTFDTYRASTGETDSQLPSRAESISVILDTLPASTFYVATTGYTARELAALRKKRGEGDERDLLVVGSMGHAISIALGVALARPDVGVICLDGDGSLVMHLGAMATVGQRGGLDLGHVLLNNRVHESVGGQPSALRHADPVGIAKACGYQVTNVITGLGDLAEVLENSAGSGPWFVEVGIRSGTLPDLPRPGEFTSRLDRLMKALQP